MLTSLTAITPIDGRYATKTRPLSEIFSEYGLIYYRTLVEVRFVQLLSETSEITECPKLSDEDNAYLEKLLANFDEQQAQQVKDIEKETNHDVKAVEYYLKKQFQQSETLQAVSEFIHFGLTSEDVNNLAYALMLQKASQSVMLPKLYSIIDKVQQMAHSYIDVAMMARTHGQPASPPTLGKELTNVLARLTRVKSQLESQQYLGKCNGAVGNYHALATAYPTLDWPHISKHFITEKLGLTFNPYTTQIEPHDWIAELSHAFVRMNTILIDFSRDVWSYISLGYFSQRTLAHEVGSSTMPHKVNPIDFENAEGNLGIANALFEFFAQKLPISRFQRDLTDSTVLRNIGVAFGHSLIAFESLLKGLSKVDCNPNTIQQDLQHEWALLAEPIQTVMRKHGIENPYEKLKALTRGQIIDQSTIHSFIETLELPMEVKKELLSLTPENYIGLAQRLTKEFS